MSEEIEKRIALNNNDKSSITEIIDLNETITEIKITYKSGRQLVIR